MKTNIIFLLLSLLVLTYSCTTKETAAVIPPDPEVDNYLLAQDYNQDLSSFKEGWIVKYQQEKESDVYTVYMKFNSDNTLSILSDYPDLNYLKEQTQVKYGLTGFLNTELTFDTYCVWHKMYDDFGGAYKFIITRQTDGNFTLQPQNQAEPMYYDLVKATPVAITALTNNINKQKEILGPEEKINNIRNMLSNFTLMEDSTYFSNINLTGELTMQGAVSFDTDKNQLRIIYRNEAKILVIQQENYKITEEGITLNTPMTFHGKEVSGFQLQQREGCNDIEIVAAGTGISGQLSHAKSPGVVPYPNIAAHYRDARTWCLLYACRGKVLNSVYNQFNETSAFTFFVIFSNYYNLPYQSGGWKITDPNYPNQDFYFYVQAVTSNEYTIKYSKVGSNPTDRYPALTPLIELYCQENGYIVLYKKKKYYNSDLGSIVLIDPNDNSNQLIIRVYNNSYNIPVWGAIEWDNMAYSD